MIRFLLPALGFAFVAIASFSVWAFGGKWLSSTTQLYSACAIVFLLFGGISLLPYSSSEGRKPLWKLVWAFPLSFLIFSILWCVGWFLFKSHFGEIMGSAFGIFAMVWLMKFIIGFNARLLEVAAVVFLFYTIGYYLGEKCYAEIGGLWGKLSWGAGFGLGMGAGLSYLVQLSARSRN